MVSTGRCARAGRHTRMFVNTHALDDDVVFLPWPIEWHRANGKRFQRRSQWTVGGETLVSKIQLRWGQHSSQLRNARLERDVFAAATCWRLRPGSHSGIGMWARFSAQSPRGNRLRTRFSLAKFSVNTPLLTSPALLPSQSLGRDEETPGERMRRNCAEKSYFKQTTNNRDAK